MDDRLKQELENFPKDEMRILDLGCKDSGDYLMLYKDFLLNNKLIDYVGVDLDDEFNIFAFGRERFDYQPFEILDNSIRNYFEEYFNDKFNLSSIKRNFTFVYKTDALDFINSIPDANFDVIILSNILHKMDNSKAVELFRNCLTHLSSNGIIYVRVLHEGSGYADVNLFSSEQFDMLKDGLEVTYDESTSLHYTFIAKIK
jgi:hypothetical protein